MTKNGRKMLLRLALAALAGAPLAHLPNPLFAQPYEGPNREAAGSSAVEILPAPEEGLDRSAPDPAPAPRMRARPLRRRDVSWTYIDRPPRPRKLGIHDIVTVIVDEKAEVLQNSRFNRQRNATLKAELKEFVKLGKDFTLDNAASNGPAIDAQLRSQLQSTGQGLSQEGMKYRIAATVVDVLPNGTLVLEARKSIRTNGELWESALTGRIRSQDVRADNTVHSENIADMNISKTEHGKIQDSTKRGFLLRTYDFLLPF
jgi:flagellar L-ring protein FlgH